MRVFTFGFMWLDGTYREIQYDKSYGINDRDGWSVTIEGSFHIELSPFLAALRALFRDVGY